MEGALNNLGKRREARIAAVAPATPEEKPTQSFDEILTTESSELSLYLDSLPPRSAARAQEAWKRLKEGKPTATDKTLLMGYREKYAEQKNKSEKVVTAIHAYAKEMLKNSPRFKKLAEFETEEKILRTIEKGLKERALKDPHAFARIEKRLQELVEFEEKIEKPLNKKISDFCKKQNIAESDKLHDALDQPTEVQRRQALQKIMREHMTWKGYFLDVLKHGVYQGGTFARAGTISAEDVPGALAQRDKLAQEGGDYLQALLSSDTELREALARESIGIEPAFKKGAETKLSFKEMHELSESATEEAVKERAREFRKKHAKDNWRKASTLNKLREEFFKSEEVREIEFRKKEGWFARLMHTLGFFKARGNADVENILAP